VTSSLILLSGLLFAPVSAGLLASVLCCLSILSDKKPPWFYAALSAPLGISCALWILFGGDVLHPTRWPGRIPGRSDLLVTALASSFCLTTAVVLTAVAVFRERYKKHLTREQRRLLSHQRHERSRQRLRWFKLCASSMLMACLTCYLVCSHSAWLSSGDTAVVTDYPAAYSTKPQPSRVESPRKAFRATSPFSVLLAEAIVWPLCTLGLIASGAWFAYTVAYWHGHMKVKPRHRRDLLVWRHPPAAEP